MDEKLHIVVSSFSDCREKNGIVTFMDILRRNAGGFGDRGFRLAFANYVDFPSRPPARPGPVRADAPTPPAPPGAATASAPGRIRRTMLAVKYWIKGQLAKRPLLAFLLMTATLSRRGLVTTLKARLRAGPGSVHFHQDAFCAYFGQWILHRSSRRILLLHSGNDSLRQVFIHFHGMRGTRYEACVREAFRRTLAGLDGIVTLNERYADTLRAQFPHIDVRCIYNTSPFTGEDADRHRTARPAQEAPGRRIEILAVGSLQPIKGFDLLVGAAAGLPDADRDRLHVTIVGGGPARPALQAAVDAAGLREVITLNGESDHVASFLGRADAYILTSRDEGFPIALIEASGFGLPIVATRVGAIPEVYDEASCLFMEPTVDSIREALAAIARGGVDLDELARRSRAVFDAKLSLDAFMKAYCELFDQVGRRHAR
ncbi:MAG TPA: glycosyltransferase [Burkholderiaceae bacterium]